MRINPWVKSDAAAVFIAGQTGWRASSAQKRRRPLKKQHINTYEAGQAIATVRIDLIERGGRHKGNGLEIPRSKRLE